MIAPYTITDVSHTEMGTQVVCEFKARVRLCRENVTKIPDYQDAARDIAKELHLIRVDDADDVSVKGNEIQFSWHNGA